MEKLNLIRQGYMPALTGVSISKDLLPELLRLFIRNCKENDKTRLQYIEFQLLSRVLN